MQARPKRATGTQACKSGSDELAADSTPATAHIDQEFDKFFVRFE